MERKIEFNVTGKERGLLAKAIGEFLGVEVRYLKVPTCNYDIGGSILDRNGTFIPADKMSDRQMELLAEQFLEKENDGAEEDGVGEVLSISVPREMFTDSALYNLTKLIEGKATLFRHAFQTEKVDITVDEEKVSFPWVPYASEPDEVAAYTEFVSRLCELAVRQKWVSERHFTQRTGKTGGFRIGRSAKYFRRGYDGM